MRAHFRYFDPLLIIFLIHNETITFAQIVYALNVRGRENTKSIPLYYSNNLGSSRTGVVYFGDDDNVYDWR